MPKLCQHTQYTETADQATGRPIKTCRDCGKQLGTCPHCKELQALDADGYISYHDFPKPARVICRGAKYSSVEDVEHHKKSRTS
jgi:hypothetical protein